MAYRYDALELGQIRVLELWPDEHDQPLRGTLTTTTLSDTCHRPDACGEASFEALSYCWGSSTKSHVIELTDGNLALTESLHSFLLRLRDTEVPRRLWADAICINQEDNSEKGKQVQLMPSVYSTARRVLADLGEGSSDTEEALDLLDQYWHASLSRHGSKEAFGRSLSPEELAALIGRPQESFTTTSRTVSLPPWRDRKWNLIQDLLLRPWFSRLWIVQEFVLARDVELFCGQRSVNWKILLTLYITFEDNIQVNFAAMAAIEGLITHNLGLNIFSCIAWQRGFRAAKASPEGRKIMDSLPEKNRGLNPYPTWIEILFLYRHCACTLERDRYYALLSLATDLVPEDHPELKPDYETEEEELHVRIGQHLLQQPDGNEYLMLAGFGAQKTLCDDNDIKLSWMLSARVDPKDDPIMPLSWLHRKCTAAGHTSEFIVTRSRTWTDAIALQGSKVDDILDVLASEDESTPSNENLKPLSGLEHHLRDCFELFSRRVDGDAYGIPAVPVDHQCLEAIVTTILASDFSTAKPRNANHLCSAFLKYLLTLEGHLAGFKGWVQVARGMTTAEEATAASDGTLAAKAESVPNFLTSAWEAFNAGVKPAVTSETLFASVPAATRPGDEIWIVSGCRSPFVLRRSVKRPGTYRVVGICWANGIMHGQALSWDDFVFRDVFVY